MTAIGGYFELELKKGSSIFHTSMHAFNSGRASLAFILHELRPSLVYVPFYCCDALLEPFSKIGTNFRYYSINKDFEPIGLPILKKNEYFLYINFFDLKRNFVKKLSTHFGSRLLIDGSMSFFLKGDGVSWLFNSCRKFFGVPDGSFLYAPAEYRLTKARRLSCNKEFYFEHLLKRFNGETEDGLHYHRMNEDILGKQVLGISKLSKYLLSHIDYDQTRKKRRENYLFLHKTLEKHNLLTLELDNESCPLYYPLLLDKMIDKSSLYTQKIFAPILWEDVIDRAESSYFNVEVMMSKFLLPLPIDQRYSEEHMLRLVNVLEELI